MSFHTLFQTIFFKPERIVKRSVVEEEAEIRQVFSLEALSTVGVLVLILIGIIALFVRSLL